MKRGLLSLLLLFTTVLVTNAQLVTGDIAFTGINSSGTADDFSFVVLKLTGIPNGTVIRFTDKGFQSGTCTAPVWGSSAEGEIQWTANTQIKYGTQVRISNNPLSSSHGTVTITGAAALSIIAGDQIFAYTGTFAAPGTMLAGIHMNIEIPVGTTNAANWDNLATITNGSNSNRPPCLTNGTYAFFFNGSTSDRTNARLKGIHFTTDRNAALAAVNDPANWDSNNGVAPTDVYALPNQTASGLPVEFTFIKALQKNTAVNVEFGIGTEENILDYTLEKSEDGRSYSEASVLPASGKRVYSLSDLQPASGNNYYRIKATEIDGTLKYSSIAVVNLTRGVKGVSVYPSVVRSNNFTLQMNSLAAGNYKLNLISALGQTVFSRNITHGGGSATQLVTLPASLQKGVYRVNMTNGSVSSVATIVVE